MPKRCAATPCPKGAVLIGRDELLRRPGAYVLQLDYRDFYELFDLKPVVSGYLHMDGAPLGAYDPSYGKMLLQLEAMGIPSGPMGLGGHARPYYSSRWWISSPLRCWCRCTASALSRWPPGVRDGASCRRKARP